MDSSQSLTRAQVAAARASSPGAELSLRSALQSSCVCVYQRANPARISSSLRLSLSFAVSGRYCPRSPAVFVGSASGDRAPSKPPAALVMNVLIVRPVVLTYLCVSNILFFVFSAREVRFLRFRLIAARHPVWVLVSGAAWEEVSGRGSPQVVPRGWVFRRIP